MWQCLQHPKDLSCGVTVSLLCIDSDPAAARGVSAGSESPSWISLAKEKHKIYKENSLDDVSVRKVICVVGFVFYVDTFPH